MESLAAVVLGFHQGVEIALAVGIPLAISGVVSFLTFYANRFKRREDERRMAAETNKALRTEIENLWCQLHAAQRRIFRLENFLIKEGYDPYEIPNGDPSLNGGCDDDP